MVATTSELRNLLMRLDAYVADTTTAGSRAHTPTATEAMATYAVAARLVESDLERGSSDLTVHREVLAATQRMLQAALAAHDGPAVPARPALRLVEG